MTLTQRVTLSAPGMREGTSRARRSSTPVVPLWVVKVRGSSPRRPVMVMLIGFTVVLLVRWPGGLAALVAARDCGALPGGQVSAPGIGRGRNRAARTAKMFCPRHEEKDSAGVAGSTTAAVSKRSLAGRISGPVAGPTARRRLTKPGRDNRRTGPISGQDSYGTRNSEGPSITSAGGSSVAHSPL